MNSAQSIAGQQSKYWRLRRSELVEGMSDADVRDLSRLCEIRVVERGRAVYDVGQVSDKVYIVESGSVKLTRTAEEGRAVNTGVLGPMEIFGELSLVGDHARLDCAEALEDAVVCGFDAEAFEAFLSLHPRLALRVAKLIGERLRRVESQIQDILFKDVRTRLAHTVARLANKFGEDVPEGRRIGLRLTQTDLAHLIGSTRETTSTIFNEFRREGLVSSDGLYIIVVDPDSLSTY